MLRSRALAQRFAVSVFSFIFVVSALGFNQESTVLFDLESLAVNQPLEFPFVPDGSLTTGSLCTPSDPDFQSFRYSERIPYCKRKVSSGMKSQIYNKYSVPTHCRREYTIDHYIPLSIGGTNHVNNLWPEHKSIKALRQDLELDLYKQLEQGLITQKRAVQLITQAKRKPPVGNPSDFTFCQ